MLSPRNNVSLVTDMQTTKPLPVSLLSRQAVKTMVDEFLADYYQRQVEHAQMVDESYAALWSAMQHLNSSGGKRIRPYVCLLAYQAFGGRDIDVVLPVAAAQELLHASLLMHDDIIDHDYRRYGVANVAGQFQARYDSLTNDAAKSLHYANAAAILAGDLLISGAHNVIASSQLPVDKIMRVQACLHQAVLDVAAGELLDSEASFRPPEQVNSLLVAELKTASYSFGVPLRIGALLADATEAELTALETYGRNVGIAFQLVDDILGVFGDSQKTGKSTSGDLLEGKRTMLLEQTLALADDESATYVRQQVGQADASEAALQKIRQIMERCGALESTRRVADQHADAALSALQVIELPTEIYDAFAGLAAAATDRVV